MNNICGSHVSWFSLKRFMNIHEGDHWMKVEVLRVKVVPDVVRAGLHFVFLCAKTKISISLFQRDIDARPR